MEEFAPPRYKLLEKLGEGVHGVVIKAEDQANDNKIVAIKKVLLKNKYGGLQLSTLREIKVLQHSDCENVSDFFPIFNSIWKHDFWIPHPNVSVICIQLSFMNNNLME